MWINHFIRLFAIAILIAASGNVLLADENAYHRYLEAHKLMDDGKYADAGKVLREVAPQLPTHLKSQAFSDLGVCCKNLGLYGDADNYFVEALNNAVTKSVEQKIRYNYSNFLLETGSYKQALDNLKKVTLPELRAQALVNMSHADYLLNNDLNRAFALLDSCLAIADKDSAIRQIALQNKGYMMLDARNYSEATKFLTRSLNDNTANDVYFQTLGNIAVANSHLNHSNLSLNQIRQTIKWFADKSDFDHRIALRKAGEIALTLGKTSLAKDYFSQFFKLEKESIFSNFEQLSRSARLNLWLKEKPLLSKCFLLEDNAPEFLYEVAMFRRQTSLLGSHDIENLKSALSATTNDVRKSLKDNEVALEFISYENAQGHTTYAVIILPHKGKSKFVKLFDESFIYEPEVVGTNSLINAISRDDANEKNILYSDTTIAQRIWGPIVGALADNVSKIYFAPEGVFHFLGIENMPFDSKHKFDISRVTSTASLTNKSSRAPGEYKALLVGGLNYSSRPVDTLSHSVNHDAAGILHQKVGNGEIFRYLPGTRTEVDTINNILNTASLTHQIGEGTLKNVMPGFQLIHIATHGYSLNLGIRKRPEFMADSLAYDISLNASGLALSGANVASKSEMCEDGILSAREICDLDLSNVDFVVLSACQTAQGDITDEGAAGLVRGLKNAGVKTIMASLWSVDDKSTMMFMQKFYELLDQGHSKHQAYIGAQEFLRQFVSKVPYRKFSASTLSPDKDIYYHTTTYNQPYFWAPFILIDDF